MALFVRTGAAIPSLYLFLRGRTRGDVYKRQGYLIQPVLGTSVSLLHMAMLGLVSAVAGQIGDLSASLVKRNVGIKDFGKIFPGHGGVMDRLDSILFVAPIVYCYFSLVLLAA